MPNSFVLPKNYISMLDEVYKLASVTADLTTNDTLVRQGTNADEVVYPHLSVTGLGDYDRNSGYTDGSVSLEWKTTRCNYDRGTKIQVDAMDNQESFNLAFGAVGAALQREKVAPESDAFTFSQICATNGITSLQETLATGAQFLESLLTAKTKMDEDEVPEENRILYVTPTLLNSVMALDTTKSREALAAFTVKKSVPQSRFYTAIDLLDGKTDGEEAGFFKKADDAAEINFMIIHKPAIIKYDKHIASAVISPDQNQSADAYMSKYRKYGLVDVYANKTAGIYVSHK